MSQTHYGEELTFRDNDGSADLLRAMLEICALDAILRVTRPNLPDPTTRAMNEIAASNRLDADAIEGLEGLLDMAGTIYTDAVSSVEFIIRHTFAS